MFTGLFAAVLLGEPARRETWIASAVAFVGVLIVLRPNLAAAGWWALLPVVSAMFFAMVIIGNRFVAGQASGLVMQFVVAAYAAPILLLAAPLFALTGIQRFALFVPDWTVIARWHDQVRRGAGCAHVLRPIAGRQRYRLGLVRRPS